MLVLRCVIFILICHSWFHEDDLHVMIDTRHYDYIWYRPTGSVGFPVTSSFGLWLCIGLVGWPGYTCCWDILGLGVGMVGLGIFFFFMVWVREGGFWENYLSLPRLWCLVRDYLPMYFCTLGFSWVLVCCWGCIYLWRGRILRELPLPLLDKFYSWLYRDSAYI